MPTPLRFGTAISTAHTCDIKISGGERGMAGSGTAAEHFGEHVTFDGYHGSRDALNDRACVHIALVDLAEQLGMTPLAPPAVYFAEGSDKKDPGGWTGFLVVQESHISIHTFPARRFLSADVYTCKTGMNVRQIIDFFIGRFGVTDHEVNFIKRGLRYPAHNFPENA